jgi:chemotaxis protein methyltransferase CheR
MDATTFKKFRELVYEMSGITLGAGKESLVSARIGKRMRALEMTDQREYLRYVMEDATGEEIVHLIDAISTNVTSFFREPEHFDLVKQQISKWLAAGQTRFRFWSAASSTGEEPYSLAITVQEALAGARADVKVLATDISTRVLLKCEAGRYSRDKLENVPTHLRDRYFELQREGGGTHCVVKPALRQMIVFQRLNLSQPPFPMHGPFDMVFCRNVMIYFDNTVRGHLLAEIGRLLKPGGYLMVGHAESLTGMLSAFKTVQPSVYRKE